MSIEFFQLLMLIIIANGAPVLARLLLGSKFNAALDGGVVLADNSPLFGTSKTWRGVFAALLVTTVCALIFDYSAEIGIQIAIFAVFGDLLSSFIKRRLSLLPSSKVPLLDQIPESLFPALMMMDFFDLQLFAVAILVTSFTIIDLIVTYYLYHWRLLRKSRKS